MKYCSNCGKDLMDKAVICPHCGCAVQSITEDDVPSTVLNLLGFFIPIVGLILFLVYHDKAPKKAKAIGKWALGGAILNLVLILSTF